MKMGLKVKVGGEGDQEGVWEGGFWPAKKACTYFTAHTQTESMLTHGFTRCRQGHPSSPSPAKTSVCQVVCAACLL